LLHREIIVKRRLLSALFLAGLSLSAVAGQYACPDLAAARQVNACPTEDELKHTYSGFCSDDKKVYGGETDNCIRYPDYRAMKNNALWESADGAFDAYVSCDLPKAKLQAMKATGMKVEKQGTIQGRLQGRRRQGLCGQRRCMPGDLRLSGRTAE
jgi:hypothetical protein